MAGRRAMPRGAWVILAALVGVLLGVGLYTLRFAEAASYLSQDPRACVNCHIMRSEYDAWQKASHKAVATCVDCHLPASGLRKWLAKGINGWNHSRAFTFQDFPEPIRITPRNAAILQENCLRCHGDLVHDLTAGSTTDRRAIQCVHCHLGVGHGPLVGLGGADRGAAAEGAGP